MDSDALRRAARTFFQGVIGVLVLLAIPVLNQLIQSVAGGGEVTIDLDLWRSIGIAAIAGGVIALIAFLQNALEDRTGSTGFLVRKS
jgi:predicted phage tail protein